MKPLFCIVSFLLSFTYCFGSDNLKALLNQLDQTIAERPYYTDMKEKRILELKQMLKTPDISPEQAYELNTRLYKEYHNYNCDSAFNYAEKALKIALFMKNDYCINDSKLNVASAFNIIGMYKEALEQLSSIHSLPDRLQANYFNHYKEVYSNYSNNTVNEYAAKYKHYSDAYRDSLLNLLDKTSVQYLIVYSEKLFEQNKMDESYQILYDLLKTENKFNLFSTYNYCIAQIMEAKGDKEQAKIYYTKSAIGDLKNVTKNYASMQTLAILLYESGDLNHAYKCIKYSMEDAIFCNARLPTSQIAKIYPIINAAYQEKTHKQKEQLTIYLILTTVLSFLLIMAIVYVYKQMKKLSQSLSDLFDVNLQLKDLNGQLQNYNRQLSEANHIKEEYIGHFLNACSTYIDKLDNYRKTLNRKASDNKIDELLRTLKSTEMVEKELAELYENFDSIFLFLFPSFVEDFNALLLPEERFVIKQDELLNVEMRIFALIRLGIADSSKIAKFLRYSSNTIYNYRAKIKNKSAIPREDFENKIMEIVSYRK
jgi:hypothetical protein